MTARNIVTLVLFMTGIFVFVVVVWYNNAQTSIKSPDVFSESLYPSNPTYETVLVVGSATQTVQFYEKHANQKSLERIDNLETLRNEILRHIQGIAETELERTLEPTSSLQVQYHSFADETEYSAAFYKWRPLCGANVCSLLYSEVSSESAHSQMLDGMCLDPYLVEGSESRPDIHLYSVCSIGAESYGGITTYEWDEAAQRYSETAFVPARK